MKVVGYICIFIWLLSIPISPVLCDCFYPTLPIDSVLQDPWWLLYKDLVTLFTLVGSFGLFQFTKSDKIGKFLTSILLGFAITDVIEKWMLNDRTKFSMFDMLGVLAVVFMTYFEQIAHPILMKRSLIYNRIVTKINGTKI